MIAPKPYANPYLAGFGLGVVLLGCFIASGQGLGASGAFASIASSLAGVVSPRDAAASAYFGRYLSEGPPWGAWMVVEVAGAMVGGAASALLAGRFRAQVVRGASLAPAPRLGAAACGGLLMGGGAVLARGCTSGLALSGGALLSVGGWTFMAALFAGGFAAAPVVRRLWR